jgi:hypothetical protein
MMHYRVERTNDIPLEFDAELLADVSSKGMTGNVLSRWTEHRIYRTSTNVYVVETVGRSVVNGEIDRCAAVVVDQAREIPAALRAPRSYLTLLAKEALDHANLRDPDVPLTERV